MPGEGRFETTEQLCQTLTSIIFTSTVGHAAVNVSQYDEYAFLPNYPAVLKGQPPRDKVKMPIFYILGVLCKFQHSVNMVP